ncbi:MAG: glycosyltransferase family 2 protein [Bacteroidales bacterium]|nr:glycosyltransferase family 2 protein [Bacteroidales bacterium]
MLSVICPIYNEEKYISHCIESILLQDYPKGDIEVLFVDGMSSDHTRQIVNDYAEEYPLIHLLNNPNKTVPYAMNIGIQAAKGDIIIRIDAHTIYEKNYFTTLCSHLIELKADNVGTVCKTDVLNKNPKTLAIREVLSNKWGVGNSTFRIGIKDIQEVDTVPFGCWRSDVFNKYGYYDVRLVRNQDIELNKRIHRGGGKIYIIPDSFCTYLARETFKGIAKNNYSNGKWNILTVYYTNQLSSLSIRHFTPLFFLLSLLLPIIASIFYLPSLFLAFVSLLCYLLVLGIISMNLSINKKISFNYLFISFITLHFSYGLGSFIALLKLPFIRK